MKGNPMQPLDKFERTVDHVLSPERIMRWLMRIVLLIVLLGVAVTVAKIAIHVTAKVDQVTTDHDWFVGQMEAIQSATLEERMAREALARHQSDVEARSGLLNWSRGDDRAAAHRLNQAILDAQTRRLRLVQDYNARSGRLTDTTILGDLPQRISVTGSQ